MKLYHSSKVAVFTPDTFHSREALDFGKGFYLTHLYDQALNYAQRFIRRKQEAWLNSYEFNFEPSSWKVKIFESYDREWLDFISKCRANKDDSAYDIVIGGIADDKVVLTLDRYFAGEITPEQALGILEYEKPNIQYCIRSQRMLDQCIKHIESIKL
ncbi:MAG: DUF3990 domain-containing protein [Bacteroidales bacterium]|nr:DUF3990 domain-containing protein [Bacteroidales bacterium]